MLQTDEIILNILLDAKKDKDNPNQLLQKFKIGYPNKKISQESNSIFIGVVDSESYGEGFAHSQFRDLVEILIVTKNRDYKNAMNIIKTVSLEIIKLIYENKDKFPNKPVIRNVTPDYGADYVITRGHILVQCITNPIDFYVDDATITDVCKLIVNDIEEE